MMFVDFLFLLLYLMCEPMKASCADKPLFVFAKLI